MSSSYHIPFPRNFLTVNTPVKKQSGTNDVAAAAVQPQQPDHGFLSNRATTVQRHQSISSVSSIASSDAAISSAPSSPPTKAADSPVLAAKSFTPLALNAKHAVPVVPILADMTPVARSAFLSNRY